MEVSLYTVLLRFVSSGMPRICPAVSSHCSAGRGHFSFGSSVRVARGSHCSCGFNTSSRHLSPGVVSSGFQPLHALLSFLSRFISRTKCFRPFGYARLSVGLLQSPAADCIVRCSGPYSLLQWTVQSIAADCNNLLFKRPWLILRNRLFFPLFVM